MKPTTLLEVLRIQAAQRKDSLAFQFLVRGEEPGPTLTFGELDANARSVAARLQQSGSARERAILLFEPGLEFISAFFACIYADAVPVPADATRLDRAFDRLRAIALVAQPKWILTTQRFGADLRRLVSLAPEIAHVEVVEVDSKTNPAPEEWREPKLDGNATAFLQFTSGSTSTPRGVMVTHLNLLAQIEMLDEVAKLDADSRWVNWAPTYHDMGLIAGVIQPVVYGVPCFMMSPLDFLKRPARWLEAISKLRATHSGGPNFAYELCATRIPDADVAGLDLRSWRVAFNGAEPIRMDTIEGFAKRFERVGLQPSALWAAYGLAEGTLVASMGQLGLGAPVLRVRADALEQRQLVPAGASDGHVRALICNGPPLKGVNVVITDGTKRLPDGAVGEIWLSGPTVTKGYFSNDEATREYFGLRLEGDETSYLRTGDLGVIYEGKVYPTGRAKDLIILRGKNHYPQDIEQTAERAHAALRRGCSTAFSIERDGDERVVLAMEVIDNVEQLDEAAVRAAVREKLFAEHQFDVLDVVLLEPRSIPKTTSGKLMRHASRQGYLKGTLRRFTSKQEGAHQ